VSDDAPEGLERPEPIPLDELDPDAISRVIKRVSLFDVRLQHTHADVRAITLPDDWMDNADLRWRADLLQRSEGGFIVEVSFILRYDADFGPDEVAELPDGEDLPTPLLYVMADFELFYELAEDEEISDTDLRHFAVFNGPKTLGVTCGNTSNRPPREWGFPYLLHLSLRCPSSSVRRPPSRRAARSRVSGAERASSDP